MSLQRDALRIYRERGAEHLVLRCVDFFSWRAKGAVKALFDRYWSVKGGPLELTVGGVSAEFNSGSSLAGPSIRRHFQMEYEMLEDVVRELRDDDVFYDIGANLGLYSVFGSRVCGEVVAFEPHPKNYELLCQNLPIESSDVDPRRIALSDEDGEELFEARDVTAEYGSGSLGRGDLTVETARVDSLVSAGEIAAPDVVKIDVEGAEGLVLEGMGDVLSSCRKVYCEVHLPNDHRQSVESYGWSPADVVVDLADEGFDVNILGSRGPELQVVATK